MSASEPDPASKSEQETPTEVHEPVVVVDPAAGPDDRLPRGRRYAVRTLLVLGTIVGIVALLAVWVNRQALNADNWANTSSSLLQDKDVRDQVSNYVVDQIYENVDVAAEIKTALPDELKPFAGTAASEVEGLANSTVNSLLNRPFVQDAWKESNRLAMEQLIRIVEEKQGGLVESERGSIFINLHPVIESAIDKLGLPENLAAQVPADAGRIEVLQNDDIRDVQSYAKLLRGLGVVLPILALLLFAAALGLAGGRRRKTLIVVGVDFIIIGAVVLAVAVIAKPQVVDAVATTESVKPAARAVWDIATQMLRDMAWATMIVSIPIILAALLAGPSEPAVSSRRFLAPWLKHQLGVAYGVVGIVVILLIVWGPFAWLQEPLPVLVMILLVVLGLELLRRQTAREYPNVPPPDLGESLRVHTERITGSVVDTARKGQAAVTEAVASRRSDDDVTTGDGAVAGRSEAATAADEVAAAASASEAPTVVSPAVAVPASAPAAPAPTEDEKLARLERLSVLYERGHLTDEEFQAQKRALLAPPS